MSCVILPILLVYSFLLNNTSLCPNQNIILDNSSIIVTGSNVSIDNEHIFMMNNPGLFNPPAILATKISNTISIEYDTFYSINNNIISVREYNRTSYSICFSEGYCIYNPLMNLTDRLILETSYNPEYADYRTIIPFNDVPNRVY